MDTSSPVLVLIVIQQTNPSVPFPFLFFLDIYKLSTLISSWTVLDSFGLSILGCIG